MSAWIGLVNPKSPSNVGSVLRACGCFGADGVLYTGNRFHRAREFVSDTRDWHETLPLIHCESLIESCPPGLRVIGVELVEGAIPLMQFSHPQDAFYVFGPEDGSLPKPLVRRCDDVVYLPTIGCLNLAATVNIMLYDRVAKLGTLEAGDALIRRSRDNNNRLRVTGQPRKSPAGDVSQ